MRKAFFSSIVLLPIFVLQSFLHIQDKPESPLETVLHKLDATAARFDTAQADFVWDQYEKVVDEHDLQKGTVYYRRAGKSVEMMAEIKEPDRKYVLYKDGTVQIYQPKIEQVTDYSAGKNRSELESFLVLGIGGSGQDLVKTYDVTYAGEERTDNVTTAKLELVPKSEKVRNTISKIVLWIDLSQGISVKQQFLQPQGDWRTAQYSAIRLHQKIPGEVFRLKTTSKTQFVSPGG